MSGYPKAVEQRIIKLAEELEIEPLPFHLMMTPDYAAIHWMTLEEILLELKEARKEKSRG